MGQQDSSAGKLACSQAQRPEFHPLNPQGQERTEFHKSSSEPTSCPSSLAQKHRPTVITVFLNLLPSTKTFALRYNLSFGSKKQYQESSSFQLCPLPYSHSHMSSHTHSVLCGCEDLPFPHPACLSSMQCMALTQPSIPTSTPQCMLLTSEVPMKLL